MSPRAAIVTTLRQPGTLLKPFLRYHLALGFERIYLFFDDPVNDHAEIAWLDGLDGITVVADDADLRRQWRDTPFFQEKFDDEADFKAIMDRQMLNAALALAWARVAGIDWLLHIDIDELFYAPQFFGKENWLVGDYFALAEARGLAQVSFLNHEALVERHDVERPFEQVTLFHVNPRLRPVFEPAEAQFITYANGKSAVHVADDGVMPDGVHDFFLPEQRTAGAKFCRRFVQNRFFQAFVARFPKILLPIERRLLARQRQRWFLSSSPVILHYPHCGFDAFWQKYGVVRHYTNHRSSRHLDELSDFHRQAHLAAQLGRDSAYQFYLSNVVVDAETAAALLAAGAALRVVEPAAQLIKGQT